MSDIQAIGPVLTLGEGPLWHPERGRLFWFDIPAGRLHATNEHGGYPREIDFGEPASAAGWVDENTLLVATASGLQRLDLSTGIWQPEAPLEADDAGNRANDGRTAPDGAFWISTMSLTMQRGAGAFYRYAGGRMHTLATGISIPNATCFAPDGRTAYLADTMRRTIWSWALDETGAPEGEREVFVRLENDNPDGAVVDADGCLWCALYGSSAVARFDAAGREMSRIALPASQPTCPAFGGPNLDTLYVTTAAQDLTDPAPEDGRLLMLGPDMLETGVKGQAEHRVVLA